MDPVETLRLLVAEYLAKKPDQETIENLTDALNGWLRRGGFRPSATIAAWYDGEGQPRQVRKVKVFEIAGRFAKFVYVDVGMIATCLVDELIVK